MDHPSFLLFAITQRKIKDLLCPAVSFPNPFYSTPLYFNARHQMFITLLVILCSPVPIALMHSNTTLSNILYCKSFPSIPSSHLCFTFQLQTLSGLHQMSLLAPY